MSESQKKALEQQLWNIANELRGKMDADEFRDYILGFIFYKYLSEKTHIYTGLALLAMVFGWSYIYILQTRKMVLKRRVRQYGGSI